MWFMEHKAGVRDAVQGYRKIFSYVQAVCLEIITRACHFHKNTDFLEHDLLE